MPAPTSAFDIGTPGQITPQRQWELDQIARGNAQRAAQAGTTAPGATPATPATPGATQGGNMTPANPAAPSNPALGPQQGLSPLGNWGTWLNSGGVNPTGWQGLGGNQNTNFLDLSHWSPNAADPGHASTNGDPLSQAQPFIDNAYGQATRQLDPQFAQQQAAFDQQMVNKGLAPGSQAYDQAKQQFDQTKNDAYSQARNQAMGQGLTAQAQSFGQGLSQSQLSSALANSLIGANTSYANQQLGGNASIMNQLLNGNSGIAQSLISGQASNVNSANAAGSSNYAAGLNNQLGMAGLQQQGQQQDFGNLMQLLGMGQGVTQYNNGLLGSDQARNQSLFSGLPNGGAGNIDVQNPYNNQYTAGLNQSMYNQNQNNAQNSQYAQWAAMIASMFGG